MLLRRFKTQNNVIIACPICKCLHFEDKKEIITVDNGMCENTEQTVIILICNACSFRLTFDSGIYLFDE